MKTYLNRLFTKIRNFFIPRKQEDFVAPPNAVAIDPNGFRLNRKQRRQLTFGKRYINNNRKHTRGRKMYKPTHQIIRLKDENGDYTGQIKQIYHYPKAV